MTNSRFGNRSSLIFPFLYLFLQNTIFPTTEEINKENERSRMSDSQIYGLFFIQHDLGSAKKKNFEFF